MQFIVKLKFTSPLHIGKGKPDYYAESETILHSDTIKSAIFSTAKLLDNNIGEDFWTNFIVSSSMPFYNDIVFFPKPNLTKIDFKIKDSDTGKDIESTNLKLIKQIKKIKYIQQSVFEELNTNKQVIFEDYQFYGGAIWDKKTIEEVVLSKFSKKKETKHLVKEYKNLKEEKLKKKILKNYFKEKFFDSGIQERVKINAIPEIEDKKFIFSRPYNIERLYFNKNAGLYFIVETLNNDDSITKEIIENSLNILCDTGFGTDKSVGNGQFEFEIIDDFDYPQAENYDYKMNLSLFLPKNIENCKEYLHRYNLIERGGYVANYVDVNFQGVLKNTISMFDIGSIFKKEFDDIGNYVDLKPDSNILKESQKGLNHPIWRDGRSLFIPINFKLIEN